MHYITPRAHALYHTTGAHAHTYKPSEIIINYLAAAKVLDDSERKLSLLCKIFQIRSPLLLEPLVLMGRAKSVRSLCQLILTSLLNKQPVLVFLVGAMLCPSSIGVVIVSANECEL